MTRIHPGIAKKRRRRKSREEIVDRYLGTEGLNHEGEGRGRENGGHVLVTENLDLVTRDPEPMIKGQNQLVRDPGLVIGDQGHERGGQDLVIGGPGREKERGQLLLIFSDQRTRRL